MKKIDSEKLYRDGRHYDLTTAAVGLKDIPLYKKKMRKYGSPVLELACGTGRVTLELATDGIDITGLDISPSMLAQARKKSRDVGIDVNWVKADVRDFELDKKFNFILFPFNAMLHLHELEDLEACFKCVKEHLYDDGRFIIDVFNPDINFLVRDPEERYPSAEYSDPDGKGTVVVTENNVYDKASQVNRIKWYYKIGDAPDEIVADLNLRILYPKELDALLKYNGFAIEDKFGDYDETPFESGSPKQIVICKKR